MELRPRLHLGVVAVVKGAFGSPSTGAANFIIGILGVNTQVSYVIIKERNRSSTVDSFFREAGSQNRGRRKLLYTLFTNPSARAGYDTRSIFKRSLTGLNSEFSFS